MTILIIDSAEVGNRIALIRYASAMSGREFALAIGSNDTGLASRLEKGKSLSHERMKDIAEACAGVAMLKKTTPEEILSFLEGRLPTLDNLVLDGSFQAPVKPRGTSFSQMSYFTQAHFASGMDVATEGDSHERSVLVAPRAAA